MSHQKYGRRRLAYVGAMLFLVGFAWVYAVPRFPGFTWKRKEPREVPAEMHLLKSERQEAQMAIPAESLKVVADYRFPDASYLTRWEEKVFKGGTRYEVLSEGGRSFLRSSSIQAASGLFMKLDVEATPDTLLRWTWRTHEFPDKKEPGRLSNRAEDDFAARVYVIFLAKNLFRSDVIEYVWDRELPIGSVSDSPYSDRIKLLVVRSGASDPEVDAGWVKESRNPREDYERLFGKAPKHSIGILALMSDSDNTGTRAKADFEEIVLLRRT